MNQPIIEMPLYYTGLGLRKIEKIEENSDWSAETLHPYEPEEELKKAVNLAILLKRPLLLMGEPGCGKTKLAQALAFELYHRKRRHRGDYRKMYFEWFVKSTSKARDGLYEFDAIARLHDAQVKKLEDTKEYIKLGPIGNAFVASTKSSRRAVVLIDEIDKADLDFPNDLLNELDQGFFEIPESKQKIKAKEKPIFIITSNQEKPLSDAFLRRCIYYYIKPLQEQTLRKIIYRRFYQVEDSKNLDENAQKLIQVAINKFIEIRKTISDSKIAGSKNISTSELLDWFGAIKSYSDQIDKGIDAPYLTQIKQELEGFRNRGEGLPLYYSLFKNWETLTDFKNNPNKYISDAPI